jgi:hypothetical protein
MPRGDTMVIVVRWFAEQRSPTLTTVMGALGALSGTRAVIAVGPPDPSGAGRDSELGPAVLVVVTLVGEVLCTRDLSEHARPSRT